MNARTNKMVSDFTGKPETQAHYEAIDTFVHGLGPVTKTAKAQVSYAVDRKFLWLWAYEQTADGTLYLNVTLDHPQPHPGVHKVTQVSPHRWNHHVEMKSSRTAQSTWLQELVTAGFEFAAR